MKYLIAILSASLLALGVLVYYQGKSAARQEAEHLDENRRFQQRVSEIQATLQQERATVARIKSERVKTDSIFQASISAQMKKTSREQKRTNELRPQIDQLADSIAVLAQFLDANDSLFAGKAEEIALLTQKIHTDSVSHASEVFHLNNQIDTLKKGTVENLQTIDGLQRSVTKLQKKSSKRLGIGISAGYGIQENNGTLTTGPTVNAGVHWTPFRF